MTKQTNLREETIINSCILRSKEIAKLTAIRINNRTTIHLATRTMRRLRSTGYFKDTEEELAHLIDDHKRSIARLLKPLFMQHKLRLKVLPNGAEVFWFSPHDLNNGYVTLYQGHITSHNKLVKDTATHILFLSDITDDPFITVKAGEIHKFSDVAHLLDKVKPAWDNKSLVQLIKKITKNAESTNSQQNSEGDNRQS